MNKKSFDTEILSVGTELLLGHVTNTDARDISEMLSKIGINVRYHTVVGDNPERLRKCVEIAKSRVDIIITTGGLGPTCDDLTKQILAEAFGLPLVENRAEREGLYDYIKYSRHFTPNNYAQAMLPEGCTVFHNNCGTAPGCAFEKDGKTVIMIPGPPKECRAMFTECDCLLQITAKAETAAEAEEMIRPVMENAAARLGEYVYGVDVECIEEAVFALMEQNGMTFAAAESCTGGEVAKRFTDIPGASAHFLGGAVTYTNKMKEKFLGIDTALLEEKGAVSYEVAYEMALRIREISGADFGVGVTGLAGPDGDGVHEVGTVFVSLAAEDGVWVRELHLGEHRTRSFIRRMAGNHVYDMMRRYMTGLKVTA